MNRVSDLWDTIKHTNLDTIKNPERRERKEQKEYLNTVLKYPTLDLNINVKFRVSQGNPYRFK